MGRSLPKRLPDKIVALAFELVGALSGTLAGGVFALKELYNAAYTQLRQRLNAPKKA